MRPPWSYRVDGANTPDRKRRLLGLRRALSPTFRAGAMVFFIPWRVVAEESGAAHQGFGGAMLLDLPGPALRLLTDVADFHFSDIPVRGDDGARAIGANERPRWSYGVDGQHP